MQRWQSAVVSTKTPIKETIRQIDSSKTQVALVVDSKRRLLGTVTDGDVRRALLHGISLDNPTELIMNSRPTSVRQGEDVEVVRALMRDKALHQIPVVDDEGVVVGLEILDDLLKVPRHDNWVVIMAGGPGTRLRPLTDDCPKPMLRVGERPILEHILEAFIGYGYRRFFFSVNYLSKMIEGHFGDGSRWGASIEYLEEHERLGTAGALSLLPDRPTKPLLVMNGDLLTRVNFNHLIEYHERHQVAATMCVRSYEHQIPYGVVEVDEHRLVAIEEKPKRNWLVSAGIYALAPEVLDVVGRGRYLDMPSLFEQLIDMGRSTAVFPVREYWIDIGRIEDFNQANGDFQSQFP